MLLPARRACKPPLARGRIVAVLLLCAQMADGAKEFTKACRYAFVGTYAKNCKDGNGNKGYCWKTLAEAKVGCQAS